MLALWRDLARSDTTVWRNPNIEIKKLIGLPHTYVHRNTTHISYSLRVLSVGGLWLGTVTFQVFSVLISELNLVQAPWYHLQKRPGSCLGLEARRKAHAKSYE